MLHLQQVQRHFGVGFNLRHISVIRGTAVIEGTYKAIDLMSKKNGGNGGTIVNVASAAGIPSLRRRV